MNVNELKKILKLDNFLKLFKNKTSCELFSLIFPQLKNLKKLSKLSKLQEKILKNKKREKVCLWGLGYKSGSSDLRESPSIKIIEFLKKGEFYEEPIGEDSIYPDW